ncbi:MAG: BrnT family toxin [Treponemataceae bacterium]|nr:MAG: BrnT family toxin [Treponemataceae bacterium]
MRKPEKTKLTLATPTKFRYNFEWDLMKNLANIEKHHVSFEDAETAFYDKNKIVIKDTKHSKREDRFFCFGAVDGKVATVRFTRRNGSIRIIGAGFWRKGREVYEEKNDLQ